MGLVGVGFTIHPSASGAAIAIALVALVALGRWLHSSDNREARRVTDQAVLVQIRAEHAQVIASNAALSDEVKRLAEQIRRVEIQIPRPPGSMR